MALFLSLFENQVGQNGRISFPASFRSQLDLKKATKTVVLYKTFTSKCIEGCTEIRMNEMCQASQTEDIFSKNISSINSLIFADARILNIDSAGRINVPQDMIDYANIKEKAVFVGCGKTFQIWNPLMFKKYQEELRKKALKNRPSLKILK